MPPVKAATDETNRIRPHARLRIPGSTRCASKNGARRFTSTVSFQSSSPTSSQFCRVATPWLATSRSTGPSARSATPTSLPGAAGSRRSAPTVIARPPAATTSAASSSAGSGVPPQGAPAGAPGAAPHGPPGPRRAPAGAPARSRRCRRSRARPAPRRATMRHVPTSLLHATPPAVPTRRPAAVPLTARGTGGCPDWHGSRSGSTGGRVPTRARARATERFIAGAAGHAHAMAPPDPPELPTWAPGTVAILSTGGGAPHAIPVSTGVRRGPRTVLLALALRRESLARLREDPRCALTVLAAGNVAVTAHGRATVVQEPMAAADRVAAVRIDIDDV